MTGIEPVMTGIEPVITGIDPVIGSRRFARCRPRLRWAPKTRPVAPAATMTMIAPVVSGSIPPLVGSCAAAGAPPLPPGRTSSASYGVSRCWPTPGMRPTAPTVVSRSAPAAGVARKSRRSRSAMPPRDAGSPVSIRTKRTLVGASSSTVGPPFGRSCTCPVWVQSRPSGERSMT
jgi:hypothetical protein